MIELSEVIAELRRELSEAIATGRDEQIRFELGPIELEATVALAREVKAGAKVRFWVVELGADSEFDRSSAQRIKVTLQPRDGASGAAPWVSGAEMPNER